MKKIKNSSDFQDRNSKAALNRANHNKVFAEYPIWKSLLVTSIPATISMLVIGLYSFIDSLLAVNLLKDPLNVRISQGLVGPFMSIMMAFSLMIVLGTATRFSVYLGQKNYQKSEQAISTGFFSIILVSVIISIFGPFLVKPVMIFQNSLLAHPDQYPPANIILDNGQNFMEILLWGFIFMGLNQFSSNMLRSEGRAIPAAIVMIVPTLINILLDFLLMSQSIGNMGIRGAAIATVSSWALGAMLGLFFYLYFRKQSAVKISIKSMRFRKEILIPLLLIGLAPFSRNFGQAITSFVTSRFFQSIPFPTNHVKVCIGNNCGAGGQFVPYDPTQGDHTQFNGGIYWGYIFSGIVPILMLFMVPSFGLIQASRAVVAYNYGAGNVDRVVAATKGAILYSFAYMLISTILILSIGHLFLAAFKVENNSIVDFVLPNGSNGAIEFTNQNDDARIVIYMIFATFPLYALQFSAMIYFQSTNRPMLSMFFGLLRGVILEIPLAIIMSYVAKDVNNGFVYWAMYPIADVLAAAIAFPIVLYQLKKVKRTNFKYNKYDMKSKSKVAGKHEQ